MKDRAGGLGGCIALGTDGTLGVGLNTHGMAWAAIQRDVVKYGVVQGEEFTRELEF